MRCRIITGEEFVADEPHRLFVARKLCKPGSIFQRRLIDGEEIDGFIALVEDFGETIGWARTEPWVEPNQDSWRAGPNALHWHTLEAFVAKDYRWRGVATFAAAGLVTTAFQDDSDAAVFHPHMMLLAKKVGLRPVLFRDQGEGWVRA
jgi:GNAT superfamily N-acetyltransferase